MAPVVKSPSPLDLRSRTAEHSAGWTRRFLLETNRPPPMLSGVQPRSKASRHCTPVRSVNHDFFKTWSSEMAYVLGYFAADGTMLEHQTGGCYIEFHSTDKRLIDMVRAALQSEHRIGIRMPKPGSKHKAAYRLQIGSRAMFSDLSALGFVQNKSNTLMFPNVPTRYAADFVRGYFDGDGCIYFKQLKFADRKKPRWIVLSLFTSGSRSFLEDLHGLLHAQGIPGGSLKRKKHGFELVFSFRASLALYAFMYNTAPDTGFFLPRKYKLFSRAIRTLYPSMRL